MTTPDVNAVIRSQQYYRLKRVVQSPGDIYELDESTTAIYIGPDSDLSEVKVTYFNPDSPNALETAVVSLNGPFVGRLDSLLKTIVPSTSQPARILISPVDIVDNAYVPPLSVAQRRFTVPAQIDLIAALKQINDIPDVRADKTFRFPSVPFSTGRTIPPGPDNGSTDLLIPIYGRRFITVTALGRAGLRMDLSLVTLQPGTNPVPRALGFTFLPSSIPPSDFTVSAVVRTNDAGRIGTTFAVDGTPSGYYTESDMPDDPLFAPFADSVTPRPRGLADMLLINISTTDDTIVESTQYVDLFIKVSDRES